MTDQEKKKIRFKKRYIFFGLAGVWVIIFIANILLGVHVGTDYDDTLSFSTPAFREGFNSSYKKFSDPFWKIVYNAVDKEKTKKNTLVFLLGMRFIGIKVDIITARKGIYTEPLEKKWSWLASGIYFTKEKRDVLTRHRYIFFLGDSDSDITEARKAGVTPIRVQRNQASSYGKRHYNPGKYGEWILPLSAGPGK